MAKPPRLLKLTKDSLSWFDIRNYDRISSWTVADWAGNLALRYMLKGVLDRGEASKPETPLSNILFQILSNPVAVGGRAGGLLSCGKPVVFDRTVIDVYDGIKRLDSEVFKDVTVAAEKWYRAFEANEHPEIPALLDGGFIDLLCERFPSSRYREEIYVDLNAPDTLLLDDFKAWLAGKRKTRKSSAPKRLISSADIQGWCRYRVLAFIDIDLFCHFTDTEISHATLGNILFPEDYDVDLPERIRKVVKPMAERIMNSEFVSSIDEQAARAE